jgi:DNA-binding transcriptional LysR family regulator
LFELNQLRCFVTIVEELHFGRAAERLNMTQPPLSRQIRLLEHQVGATLLERSSRGVRLTTAGKVFLPRAARILRVAQDAIFMARRAANGEQGSLAVGFTAGAGYNLLPQAVRRLREQVPGVALTLKEMVSTAQVDALNLGEIDLGLMRPHALNAELESEVLATEALLLAIPDYEADMWPAVPTLADLHGKPFIMYSPHEARPMYQMLSERFARQNIVPDVVEHIGQVHAMLALVGAGIGAALIAEGAARLKFDGVITRKVDTPPVDTVCVFRRDNANPVLQLFRKRIVPTFRSVD